MTSQTVERNAGLAVLAALLLCVLPALLRVPNWIGLLFLTLWLLRALQQWRGGVLPPRWLLLLALALPLAKLLQAPHALFGREGGVGLLAVLTAFKLLETQSLRDWRMLLALGFFLTVTPLLFDQPPPAALWLLLSLLALTAALARLAGQSVRSSLRQTGLVLLLGLPLTLVLFVVLPRLPGPLWNLPQQDDSANSGLSPVMSPGSISRLILNGDPAFSAVFDRPPRPSELYWRMLVLDRFDGLSWRNGGSIQSDFNAEVQGGRAIDYAVTAKPQSGRLPALDLPLTVPDKVLVSAGHLFNVLGPQQNERRIRVRSAAGARLFEPLSPLRRNYYLQLPPGNPQARALAAQWRASGGDELAWIVRALSYYRTGQFRYTLTPPPLHGDMIDAFLFETRQGFCEHYAASLAFLARAAGIPSRVVIGYQGGDYNPLGGFWQVRSSDAHAWVELWQAGAQAWVRVDPTAAAMPGRVSGGVESALPDTRPALPWGGGRVPPWIESLRQGWRAAQFQWQQWVIGYDAERQRNLFARLGLGVRVDVGTVLRALAAGLLPAVLPLLLWLWRRRTPVDPLQDGWRRLRRRLAEAGVATQANDGPLELLHKARALPPEAGKLLQTLVHEYIALRYRAGSTAEPSVQRWHAAVRRFRPRRADATK